MIETLADRLGEPGGPHHGAPDKTAGAPAGHARSRRAGPRIPFTTGILVGIGETPRRAPRRAARDRGRARAPRSRAGGDRPELPAQAGHRDAPTRRRARPTSCSGPIAVARLVLGAAMHLQAPPNLTDADDLGDAARGRHRRLGRRLAASPPDHVNPERPWPALDAAARRDRGRRARCSRRASPSTPSTCATRRRGSTPTCASPVLVRVRPRRPRARRRRGPRAATSPPAACSCSPPTPAPRRRPGRRGARRRARRRGGRRRRDRHAARRARARASPRVAAVADELRREIVGDAVTFVRNRNINYTNVCTFKCRFCAFSKGPLSLNLRGDPYLLDLEEMQRRVRRGRRVRRDRGVPAGRDPPRLRRRLLPRRRPGGEGGRAATSTSTASPRSRSPRAPAGSTCRSRDT